jgi:light-regulated signal transduction histidine kinase (bacteriophytochrome)
LTELLRVSAAEIFPVRSVLKVGQRAECSPDVLRPGGAIVVFAEADWPAIAQAQGELDDSGLPRWAVVVCHSGVDAAAQTPVDVISKADENPVGVSRVLRLAWDRHLLRRENARMRGEMLTFGTRITHDMRTPLGGVLTTAEMLREILGEDAPQDVALIQPILDSTDGLVKLIERSSAFARATTTLEPPRRLDMGVAFWNAFQRLESLLVKSNRVLIQPPGWPTVEAHESGMEWVWRTLLANAIQHGAAAGKIEAGWTAEAEGSRFWVRNDGVIAPEKRATLFTPFHRLHEPNAPRGLGLPLMRRLVEIEGGHCGFDAKADVVEFYFVLPAISPARPSEV